MTLYLIISLTVGVIAIAIAVQVINQSKRELFEERNNICKTGDSLETFQGILRSNNGEISIQNVSPPFVAYKKANKCIHSFHEEEDRDKDQRPRYRLVIETTLPEFRVMKSHYLGHGELTKWKKILSETGSASELEYDVLRSDPGGSWGKSFLIGSACALFVYGTLLSMAGGLTGLKAKEAEEAKLKHEELVRKEEFKESGEACFSGWDGSNPDFVRHVKSQLKYPESFTHIRTMHLLDEGVLNVTMIYEAKNSFGVVDRAVELAKVTPNTCQFIAESWL